MRVNETGRIIRRSKDYWERGGGLIIKEVGYV